MTTALVELRDVRKSYFSNRIETPVLHGINLAMQRGEFVAIMGQSGSGKSTLMNVLGCLDTPTAGSYSLAGEDVGSLSRAALAGLRNRTIGFVFQSFNLLKRMSILDNVALPLIYAGVNRKQARERAQHQLARVGLGELARRQPNQLSGGQQQRVSIARALVRNPAIILADEPTGALDSHTGREVLGMLQDLHGQGHTVVLITHDNSIAVQADRIIRLEDGQVVYDGDSHAPEAMVQPTLLPETPEKEEQA